MSTPHESDPFAFDDHLRSIYGADEVHDPAATPPGHIWAGVEPHLPPSVPPTPVPRRSPLLTGIGGVILGVLLMLLNDWWQAEPMSTPGAVLPAATLTTPAAARMTPAKGARVTASAVPASAGRLTNALAGLPPTPPEALETPSPMPSPMAMATLSAPTKLSSTPDETSVPKMVMAGLSTSPAPPAVMLPLLETESQLMALGTDTSRSTRERRRDALLTQRAELARLQHRTDSLLLALGEATAAAAAVERAPTGPKRRWSVILALAPERNFFGLGAPAGDTLSALRRTHEQGRGGYNASVMAEYRVSDRLSVGAGLGTSAYGAELRLTEQHTTVSTEIDSTTTTSTVINSVDTRAYIIRQVTDSLLSPILDFNNVLIGYEYRHFTRPDTVWTYLTNTQVTNNTSTTYTPTVSTRQERSARVLKPNYRFLTVPLLVRYRFGRATDWTSALNAPRWWVDVAVGAQLQWFLGGTQVTTRDGLTLRTERVGPRGGPFRSFNVALTGAVAFNYALTPRFSASLAPTLRYQVESVYRASTNLTQKPTATGLQLGLRYAF